MSKNSKFTSVFLLFFTFSISAYAIQVVDDAGNVIKLNTPAKRIITLAPYLTELVYSAGAGDHLIATVSYSDYPESASTLPVIGDSKGIDIEGIVAMKPDLVINWQSGNGTAITNRLNSLGIAVFQSEPESINEITTTILRIGKLTGTGQIATANAALFSDSVNKLNSKYSNQKKVSVFYQFWNKPIYTVGGPHLISRLIEFCGGENIFAAQNTLTLNVDIEAILGRDPAIIIASGENNIQPQWLDAWNKWKNITAVKNRDLYFIPPELIQRHTVRITQGMEMLCEYIDKARSKN